MKRLSDTRSAPNKCSRQHGGSTGRRIKVDWGWNNTLKTKYAD